MHFFAQLSNSERKTSTRVRKYPLLRLLKQANGAKKCNAPLMGIQADQIIWARLYIETLSGDWQERLLSD
jgi:hypothetical protein